MRLIKQFKLNFSFIYQNQAIYIDHQKAVRHFHASKAARIQL